MKARISRSKRWLNTFEKLKDYQLKFHRVAPRKDKQRDLLNWYYTNRKKFYNGTLSVEESKSWQQLPIHKARSYRPSTFEAWMEDWQELKEFQETTGQLAPHKKENHRLYIWYQRNFTRNLCGILESNKRGWWYKLPLIKND
jgi:hypothetical protein